MVAEKPAEKKEIPKLIVDHRERMIIKLLKERYECIIEEQDLGVGDFLLSDRVVVERKTTDDLLQSITDGRLFNQLILMKQLEKPILLIEGRLEISVLDEKDINGRKISPNAYRGALASVAIDYGIPVLWTNDEQETAGLVYQIAKREQFKKDRPVPIRIKRKFRTIREEQEYLVCGLPKVSVVLGRRLLNELGSPRAIFSADDAELQKVRGIGRELAARFRRVLSEHYERSILEDKQDKKADETPSE